MINFIKNKAGKSVILRIVIVFVMVFAITALIGAHKMWNINFLNKMLGRAVLQNPDINGLQFIYQDDLTIKDGIVTTKGKLKNKSDNFFKYVLISYDIYDKNGNIVSSGTLEKTDIKPRSTVDVYFGWHIGNFEKYFNREAYTNVLNAAYCKFSGITVRGDWAENLNINGK